MKRISRQRQTKKREDNIQPIIVNLENSSSSLHSAADSRRRGAVQAEIDAVSVSDGVNRFNGTNKLPVREEIDISAKQISSKFSDMGNHNDEDILKFDEEMETPSSAIIKNYANCVPKKSKICSAAGNFSRHGQTDKNRIGKASDWKAKPRYTEMTSEDEVELSFQTVNSQGNEIAFETRHIVFEEPSISCYHVTTQGEMNTMSAPQGTNYSNDTRDLLVHEQPNIHTADKLSNAEECNSKQ